MQTQFIHSKSELMLELFEDFTYELTDYETSVLLPLFLAGFRGRVGPGRAVTNKMIVQRLKEKQIKISDARVRKLINHIRVKDLVPGLIATSRGYYVSKDPDELKKYIHSLAGREYAIREVRAAMQKFYNSL